jgi:hypothetical protein
VVRCGTELRDGKYSGFFLDSDGPLADVGVARAFTVLRGLAAGWWGAEWELIAVQPLVRIGDAAIT